MLLTGQQCPCGGPVSAGNSQVVYCSIAHLWPNGTDFQSKMKGRCPLPCGCHFLSYKKYCSSTYQSLLEDDRLCGSACVESLKNITKSRHGTIVNCKLKRMTCWYAGIRNTGGFTFDPSSTAPFIAFTSQQPQDSPNRRADDLLYYQYVYNVVDLGTPLCQWCAA